VWRISVSTRLRAEASAHLALPHRPHVCGRPGKFPRVPGPSTTPCSRPPQTGYSRPGVPCMPADPGTIGRACRNLPTSGHPASTGRAGSGRRRQVRICRSPEMPKVGVSDCRSAKAPKFGISEGRHFGSPISATKEKPLAPVVYKSQ